MTLTSSESDNTIRTLCEAIWRIENQLDLLNRSVHGVFYWRLIRLEVLTRLAQTQDLYSDQTMKSGGTKKVISHLARFAVDWPKLISVPKIPADNLLLVSVFSMPRKNMSLPIHAMCLEDDTTAPRTLVLFTQDSQRRFSPASRHRRLAYTLHSDLGRLLGWPNRARFTRLMREEWRAIDDCLTKETGLKLPVNAEWIALQASTFVENRRLMRRLFSQLQFRRVFVQSAYSHFAAVAAAQDIGMDVNELQHGLITPYHLGYSFPGRPIVPYSPNRLLLFGPYWRDAAALPANVETVVTGAHYLQPYKRIRAKKRPRKVVAISQDVLGQKLFEAVRITAERAPEWTFVFRPHPQESFEHYQRQISADICPNLTISPVEEDFSALLDSAEVQIGVFSTALFEGMTFGLRTILLALPGIEYMEKVIERGEAALAQNALEVPPLLETAPCAPDPEKYYSEAVSQVNALLGPPGAIVCARA